MSDIDVIGIKNFLPDPNEEGIVFSKFFYEGQTEEEYRLLKQKLVNVINQYSEDDEIEQIVNVLIANSTTPIFFFLSLAKRGKNKKRFRQAICRIIEGIFNPRARFEMHIKHIYDIFVGCDISTKNLTRKTIHLLYIKILDQLEFGVIKTAVENEKIGDYLEYKIQKIKTQKNYWKVEISFIYD